MAAVDPNTIAYFPPETLSREQNRYVERGEYRVVTVEHVAGPEGTAGYDVQVKGELVHMVSVIDREPADPVLHFEGFVASSTDVSAVYDPQIELTPAEAADKPASELPQDASAPAPVPADPQPEPTA
jgi:hypothetical protein